ncbi:MAG: enoyl-CoA hydratase/isomerase family protein [Desulfarculaceae bacterium]|nr:enoyl-CoA hydratase/isomerase family protein [Desulfarculaceae bacterium]MCF8073795.1 enoyl-CoA hydratase/isomerase family protein [Desulfarculaceae bacterium]MCF8102036.1 enoyl-CoA hydratase/isomerase family protein [Desulfarculaceae bacterium]MCF8116006.1 enoyl-CoA hydratase/isomerase family protein [Desulfarculaceae bacterium]
MTDQPAYARLDRDGPVAVVTMDNPPTMNAMDTEMGPRLARTLEGLAHDPEVRVVILTGAGGNFTGGGNLKRAGQYLDQHPGSGAGPLFAGYLQFVVRVAQALVGLPQPVISAVEGASSGAGLAWMLASDLVVTADNARIVPGFVAAGLVPAAGATWHLPRLVGNPRAAQRLMLGKTLRPAEAMELGLVNRLCPPGQALDTAKELAAQLASGPRRALAATKRLLHASLRGGIDPHLEDERRAVVAAADDPEFARRVRRFLGPARGSGD